MNENRQRLAAFSILALLLAVIGTFVVPAHAVSIWGDREFTGWIAPIADRLSAHSRLYAEGLHSPMPPLPFILVHLLWPRGALWIDTNLLYFLFQTGLILLLFLAFSRQLGPAAAFICALLVIPVYFAFAKTLLYDAMAQFFVGACGMTTVALVSQQGAVNLGPVKCPLTLRLLLGLELALLALTKQNTFTGTAVGVCVALVFLPRAEAIRKHVATFVAVMLSSGVFFCIISLALNRWISFSGMIYDVWLTGSEPKGGTSHLIKNLLHFGGQVGVIVLAWGSGLIILYLAARRYGQKVDYMRLLDECVSPTQVSGPERKQGLIILWSLALGIAAFGTIYIFSRTKDQPITFIWFNHCRHLLLDFGLTLVCFFAGCVLFRKFSPKGRDWGSQPLAAYAVIFFLSAMFHNLSVGNFRWFSDNNPLVFSAVAFLTNWPIGVCGDPVFSSVFGFRWVRYVLVGVCLLIFWADADTQIYLTRDCTVSWPEVKHLAHARLRPQAAGLRSLVATVRAQTDPARHETVLLLPNDPNIEAWFERERPHLSSAIIFPDQYWDRYVERDLASLKAHPPKVIIIGPRNFWRGFSQQWHKGRGAERLINMVKDEILEKNYKRMSEQPIRYREENDFMDVYVRHSQ